MSEKVKRPWESVCLDARLSLKQGHQRETSRLMGTALQCGQMAARRESRASSRKRSKNRHNIIGDTNGHRNRARLPKTGS